MNNKWKETPKSNGKHEKKKTPAEPLFQQHRAKLAKKLEEHNKNEDLRINHEMEFKSKDKEYEKIINLKKHYDNTYTHEYLTEKLQNLVTKLKLNTSGTNQISNSNTPGRSYLTELTIQDILHIISFLDLFEGAILGTVNKMFRQIYTQYFLHKDSELMGYYYATKKKSTWEQQYNMHEKMIRNANYTTIFYAIKFSVSTHISSYPLVKTLALSPKPNYFSSLISLMPLVADYIGLSLLASYIVSGQLKPTLDQFFTRYMNDSDLQELMCMIVGELIVRNEFPPPNIVNGVTRFYDQMAQRKHVIASISPRILYIENGLQLDKQEIYGQHLIGFSKSKIPPKLFSSLFPSSRPLPEDHLKDSLINRWKTYTLDDITTFEDQKLAWGSHERCGVVELRVMRVNRDAPLISTDIFPVLLESNLDYLRKQDQPKHFNQNAYGLLTPFAAFGFIFRAVVNYRIEQHRVGSAYGRVVTWKILSSLVGVPLTEGIEKIEAEAKKCEFLMFQAPREDYYESFAVKSGLGVLRSDKKTVSFVALETGQWDLKHFKV